jgi:hypothetical protein
MTLLLPNICRGSKRGEFKCLHTQNLNQDPFRTRFEPIRSYCGSDDNPTVGQFVDALKTSITSGLDFRGLCVSNYEDGGVILLDNLQSLLRTPDASSPNVSTSHGKKTRDDV